MKKCLVCKRGLVKYLVGCSGFDPRHEALQPRLAPGAGGVLRGVSRKSYVEADKTRRVFLLPNRNRNNSNSNSNSNNDRRRARFKSSRVLSSLSSTPERQPTPQTETRPRVVVLPDCCRHLQLLDNEDVAVVLKTLTAVAIGKIPAPKKAMTASATTRTEARATSSPPTDTADNHHDDDDEPVVTISRSVYDSLMHCVCVSATECWDARVVEAVDLIWKAAGASAIALSLIHI